MTDDAFVDAESELAAALERCHELITDPAPPVLPPGYRGFFGHFPVYFPEEIPHAAGLLPVNVLGGGNRLEIRLADARLGSFVCSICRSTTELGLNGTFKDLKGLVTHPICDAAKHLAGIWARNFPEQPAEILYLPQNVNTAGATRYIADEYSGKSTARSWRCEARSTLRGRTATRSSVSRRSRSVSRISSART